MPTASIPGDLINSQFVSNHDWIDPNSGDAGLAFETNFSTISMMTVLYPATLRIRESGVDLLRGTNNLAFAKDKSGQAHTITWNGQQIGDKTWTNFSIIAAETINEKNQFVTQLPSVVKGLLGRW